jgi:hypothetical protein
MAVRQGMRAGVLLSVVISEGGEDGSAGGRLFFATQL